MKVTPEALLAQSQQCARTADDQLAQSRTLLVQIQSMLASDWQQSQAAVQFEALYAQWQEASTRVGEALHGIGSLLGSAATTYTQTDQQIATGLVAAM